MTIDAQDNFTRNQQHYDPIYAHVTADSLIASCRDADGFLDVATRTHASWVGLYANHFRQQVVGKRILEIGSGDGLNALLMASIGAKHVTAVDLAMPEQAIRDAAAALNLSHRITTHTGDFTEMAFPHPFDLVVGKAFLHHLTHDQESVYLERIASLLTPFGEARFFEPATNSRLLDNLRWLVPVPRRPSMLQRRAFAAWQAADPHPRRDNSSAHYRAVGERYFETVEIIPLGAIERFYRLLPARVSGSFRRAAFRVERLLPLSVQCWAARSQTLIYSRPRVSSSVPE